MICCLCLQICGKTEGAGFWASRSSRVQPGILVWEESRAALRAATGLSPLCPLVGARWLGDQAVVAGSVLPVTFPAVASLQPHLWVRTTRVGMWLAQNNFRALPRPAHEVMLPVLALWGSGMPCNLRASCCIARTRVRCGSHGLCWGPS